MATILLQVKSFICKFFNPFNFPFNFPTENLKCHLNQKIKEFSLDNMATTTCHKSISLKNVYVWYGMNMTL